MIWLQETNRRYLLTSVHNVNLSRVRSRALCWSHSFVSGAIVTGGGDVPIDFFGWQQHQ